MFLGANTLGLIVATGGFSLITVLAAVVAIFIGTFYLSAGEIRRVSQELFLMRYPNATATLVDINGSCRGSYLWLIFRFPILRLFRRLCFGAGVSYKIKFVSVKPFLLIVLSWIIAPLLSFAVGLIIGADLGSFSINLLMVLTLVYCLRNFL